MLVYLVHMNGRAYDYNLGRFLSVDPFIQSPGNSQSMNPYSYIMNNPLAGTDPSGYVACDETDAGCSSAELKEGDKILEDENGNRYLDQGGDSLIKIESVKIEKSNGTSSRSTNDLGDLSQGIESLGATVEDETALETKTRNRSIPENQNSINRVLNTPSTVEEREQMFEKGLQSTIDSGFVSDEALSEIRSEVDTFYLTNGYDNVTFNDSQKALEFLKQNPSWHSADGIHTVIDFGLFEKHKIVLYATSTASSFLRNVGELAAYRNAGNKFDIVTSGMENMVATIVHEVGHHDGLDHNVSMWNLEFRSVKAYREQ